MGIGGGPSIGMMRGGVLNNAGARGVRIGSIGRGSHTAHGAGQPGGHRGGRGGWHNQNNHNRRGALGGGRGRGSGYQHINHSRDGGVVRFNAPSTLAEKERSGKREEARQTLTDFRIVGLEIESLEWRWGTSILSQSVDESKAAEPVKSDTETVGGDSQLGLTDGVEEIEFGSAIKEGTSASATPEVSVVPPKVESTPQTPSGELPKDSRSPGPSSPSPPRIRIYFNTPASLDDPQPKTVNGVLNVSANRAKRKLPEEEEEEGRRRRTKLNPTSEAEEVTLDSQSKAGDMEKDRESVAPSVDMSATASVSGRTEDEGDWLMEAIGRDAEATEDGQQEESINQPAGEVDVEVEDDLDAEFADANHVKEDLGLLNDTDSTPLVITTGLADTGNEDPILNSKHGEEENPATGAISVEPFEDLPATQLPGTVGDRLLPRSDIILDSPVKSAGNDPHIDPDPGPDPEPPASPASQSTSQQSLSQTLHSSGGSFTSLASPHSQATTLAVTSKNPGLINETVSSQHRLPSANRVSISYASGARRLLIDAQVVETLKIWRGQGRIEILLCLQRQSDMTLKGLLVSIT